MQTRRLLSLITVGAVLFGLGGCGGGGGGGTVTPAPPQPQIVTVAGRVVDATTETGVPGAAVSLTEQSKMTGASRQVVKHDETDAEGYYAIEEVQPGQATLAVELPDGSYQRMEIQIVVPGDRPTASVYIRLVPRDVTQPTSVSLTPENPSVQVGSTLQFTAHVQPAESGVSAFFAVQGDLGTINAEGLFTAMKPGAGTVTAHAGSASDSTTVTVTSPPPTKGAITGVVTAQADRPVEAATIRADGAEVSTSADGSYTITDLSPGSYTVTAVKSGLQSATQTVEVVAGQVKTVNFQLQPGVTITVSPSSLTLALGGTQTFTATVIGSSNTSVTWSVQEGASGGTISAAGAYTAPTERGTYHVVATSNADANQTAMATVSVQAGSATGTVE